MSAQCLLGTNRHRDTFILHPWVVREVTTPLRPLYKDSNLTVRFPPSPTLLLSANQSGFSTSGGPVTHSYDSSERSRGTRLNVVWASTERIVGHLRVGRQEASNGNERYPCRRVVTGGGCPLHTQVWWTLLRRPAGDSRGGRCCLESCTNNIEGLGTQKQRWRCPWENVPLPLLSLILLSIFWFLSNMYTVRQDHRLLVWSCEMLFSELPHVLFSWLTRPLDPCYAQRGNSTWQGGPPGPKHSASWCQT